MKYAQLLKSNNKVNLIGGNEVGLPIFEHELCYCIDITDRDDEIQVNMVYSPDMDTFAFPVGSETPIFEPPSLKDEDYLLLNLIEQDLLK